MMRHLLAAALVVLLAACQPSARIDKADPLKGLIPWNPEWRQVQTLDGGVQYVVVRQGDSGGANPRAVDEVTVHYEGRLASDGKTFDSSYERGEPATFRLNQVIPGWTIAVQAMKPGDEIVAFIPSAVGYAERGAGDDIPPNADLVFRIALEKIVQAPASDEAAWAKHTPWPINSVDVNRSSTGLEHIVLASGDPAGPTARDQDYVQVHTLGKLDDGTVVVDTFAQMEPLLNAVGDFAPGWVEALKQMRKGDRWLMRVPPSLMYGKEGDGRVPPDTMTTFEVYLENVIVIEDTPPQPAPQQ
jgi:FKBP-type peptidyl-prolyl cis-trans isomerase